MTHPNMTPGAKMPCVLDDSWLQLLGSAGIGVEGDEGSTMTITGNQLSVRRVSGLGEEALALETFLGALPGMGVLASWTRDLAFFEAARQRGGNDQLSLATSPYPSHNAHHGLAWTVGRHGAVWSILGAGKMIMPPVQRTGRHRRGSLICI